MKQPDFPEMLRFLITCNDANTWPAIASSVASMLPAEEAYQTLVRWLETIDPASSANLLRAVSNVGHPEAKRLLKTYLETLQNMPELWYPDPCPNRIAFAAICAIKYLIAVGESAEKFDDAVRALSEHPCQQTRETCRGHLKSAYAWLS